MKPSDATLSGARKRCEIAERTLAEADDELAAARAKVEQLKREKEEAERALQDLLKPD